MIEMYTKANNTRISLTKTVDQSFIQHTVERLETWYEGAKNGQRVLLHNLPNNMNMEDVKFSNNWVW